jgi:hypothetical protein
MTRLLKAISITIMTLLLMPAMAQECDTIIKSKDTADVQFFYNNIDSLALGRLNPINVSLFHYQLYNPLFKKDPFYAYLGNIGLAHKRLDYKALLSNEFSFGITAFDKYRYTNENTEYYRVNDPYTELYYVMGAKKEQLLRLKFHRRIIGNFSLGVTARYINSPGFYPRQGADNKNLVIYGQWYTGNRRYGVLANYIHNKVYVQENGGIANDTTFEENLETNREIFPVNLANAENQTKDNSFFINQYFHLSKPRANRKGINLGRLTYSFNQFRQTQKYIDANPASGFYQNIYDDSTQTLDSVYYFRIENQLTWSNLEYDDTLLQRPLYIYLGVRHRYIELAGYMPKKYIRQWSPVAGIHWNFAEKYHVTLRASYTFGDYNNDDYYGRIALGRVFGNDSVNGSELAIIAEMSRQAPAYFFQEYHSNNFSWSNNFSKQEYLMAKIFYRWKRLSIGLSYYQLKNFIALDLDAQPFQYDGTFDILKAFIYKDFKIGKFNLMGRLVYQQAGNQEVIKLPDFLAYVTFVYTTPIFNRAATIQPGIDIYYATAYYADAYMPALRSFHLQSEKQIGDYPFVDLFFMLRIKRARLFLKYQNFSGLFGNYTYYTVPHYPMKDPSFRFGVNWKFFD